MTEELLSKYKRDTIELAIEESVQEAFSDWATTDDKYNNIRDDMYGRSSGKFNQKLAAIILTGLYLEYGGDSENLALELLLYDVRNRDEGQYPGYYCATIRELWIDYNKLKNSPFHEGELFRHRQGQAKERLDKKLEIFRDRIFL